MPDSPSVRLVRHHIVRRQLQVEQTLALGPSMRRLVFSGDELQGFISPAPDDHVKLFFPNSQGEFVLPQLTEAGPRYQEGVEPSRSRDYTPLYNAAASSLSIDFVLHGAGLATTWAHQAQPGQTLCIAGPRASTLIEIDAHGSIVLAGDETALPALARWLATLAPSVAVHAVVEIADPSLRSYLPPREGLQLHWLERGGQAAGLALQQAVLELARQVPQAFFWVACESQAVRSIRQHLERQGIPKDSIRASGYWKRDSST